MSKKKIIGTIVLVVLCLIMAGLIYCQHNSLLMFASKTEQSAPGAMPGGAMPSGGFPGGSRSSSSATKVNVGIKNLTKEDFVKSIIINGEVVGDVTEKSVSSDISGKITEVLVERGDKVKVGDPLCVVDPSTPGVTYKARTVTSPVSGTVTAVSAYVNQSVTTQSVLVTIGEPEANILTLEVPERYFRYIEKGVVSEFSTIAYPEETHEAVVRYVDSSVNQSTRTIKVELDIISESEHILSGMFVRARLVTEKVEDALVVPTSAISTYLGDKVVYVEENGKAVRKNVTVGSNDDNNTVILSGLSEGDKVIISGTVSDGSLVNIVSEK